MGLVAIGDIHGCVGSLRALLKAVDPSPEDHLIFIGDYVDRGPDSRGVIDLLLELRRMHRCTFLRGNHEAMMLDYLHVGETRLWYANGGRTTLESYRANGRLDIAESHVSFLEETTLYHDEEEYFFVHAGLKPEYTVAENMAYFGEEVFLWERSHLSGGPLAWEKTVVCGHTPHQEVLIRELLICIDTGCVYYMRPEYGRLTAIRLPSQQLTEVPYQG